MKNLFKKFLTERATKPNGTKYAKTTIENYSSMITIASNLLEKKFYLLDDNEIDFLSQINKQLRKGGEKEDIGDTYNSSVRATLKLYEEFRKDLKKNPGSYLKNLKKSKNEQLLEEMIETNFNNLPMFKDYQIVKRQFKDGNYKFDMLLEHKSKPEFLVVEIKDLPIFSQTIAQISNYINSLRSKKDATVKGIIIGKYLTEEAKQFYKQLKKSNIEFVKYNLNIELEKI